MECTLEQALRNLQENGGKIKIKNSDIWFIREEMFGVIQHLSAYDVLKTWVWEPENKSAFHEWNDSMPISHFVRVPSYQDQVGGQIKDRKEGWNAALDAVLKLDKGIIPKSREGLSGDWAILVKQIEKLKDP